MEMIVAVSANWGIGKDNKLPWHLTDDLRWFRGVTLGKTIIMGRRTFDSIGQPLDKRENIVLSRTLQTIEGCKVESDYRCINSGIVIGGEQIYKLFLPHIQTIYLTIVHQLFDTHSMFPQLTWEDWVCTHYSHHTKDIYPFSHLILNKRVDEKNKQGYNLDSSFSP